MPLRPLKIELLFNGVRCNELQMILTQRALFKCYFSFSFFRSKYCVLVFSYAHWTQHSWDFRLTGSSYCSQCPNIFHYQNQDVPTLRVISLFFHCLFSFWSVIQKKMLLFILRLRNSLQKVYRKKQFS